MEYKFGLSQIIEDNKIDSLILKRIILDTKFSRKAITHHSALRALEYL